jgi:hypothetical protein
MRMITPITVLALHLVFGAGGLAAPPDESKGRSIQKPVDTTLRTQLAAVRRMEFVEMLSAVVRGSQMGPGDGWFHPSESRYTWAWLAERCHVEQKGKIARKDFPGGAEVFDRLDRNHDGVLSAEDFDWSERSPLARQGMPAGQWFRMIDKNSNGRISREEWDAYFERVAKGKAYLTAEDLRDAFPLAPPPRPPNAPRNEGPTVGVLLKGLLGGELGSPFEGPKLGQRGPDFTLKTPDGKEQITLSQLRGKPVVLVFGSFT